MVVAKSKQNQAENDELSPWVYSGIFSQNSGFAATITNSGFQITGPSLVNGVLQIPTFWPQSLLVARRETISVRYNTVYLGASAVRQTALFRSGRSVESLSHPRAETFGSLPFNLLLIFERNSTVSHDNLKHKQQTNLDLAPPPSPARSSLSLLPPGTLLSVLFSIEFTVHNFDDLTFQISWEFGRRQANPSPQSEMLRVSRTGSSFSYLLGERREAARQALRTWPPAGKYRPRTVDLQVSKVSVMRRCAAAPTVDYCMYRVPASGVMVFHLNGFCCRQANDTGCGCHHARREAADSVYYIEILPGSGIPPSLLGRCLCPRRLTPRRQLETTYRAPISRVTFRWLEYIEFRPASDISDSPELIPKFTKSQLRPCRKFDFCASAERRFHPKLGARRPPISYEDMFSLVANADLARTVIPYSEPVSLLPVRSHCQSTERTQTCATLSSISILT
ncbi:hypothetical protein R3P38DRAFT_3346665 [Favolaschia claudopus]|uniref:Uncharacterized protein n=1 Tax=Favolaschia claudopus TaxID=2862362 RepID=A0AAW0D9H6_9AGAR